MVSYFRNMNFYSSVTNSSSLQMENTVGDKQMDEERGFILGRRLKGEGLSSSVIDEGRGITLKIPCSLCIFLGETSSDLRTALSPKLCSEFCLLQRSPGSIWKAFLHFLQSSDENFPGLPYMPRAPVKACVFGRLCLETKPLVDPP